MKKILLVLFILALCAGTQFWGCLGFLFFVWIMDLNQDDKDYDPEIHRKYISSDRKL